MAEIKWSDLHHSLTTDASGNIRMALNAEAVKTSIDNILRTTIGSRVMLPEFGSNLHRVIFSPMTQALGNSISNDIRNSITRWDDRVQVNSVDIYQYPDENRIKIDISFSIKGFGSSSYQTSVDF